MPLYPVSRLFHQLSASELSIWRIKKTIDDFLTLKNAVLLHIEWNAVHCSNIRSCLSRSLRGIFDVSLALLTKVTGDVRVLPPLWLCHYPPAMTNGTDWQHPPTQTHAHISHLHTAMFLSSIPRVELVTSIKRAIVSFSLGWRKELYLTADVWPTHRGARLCPSMSKCISKWICSASRSVLYVCIMKSYITAVSVWVHLSVTAS